MNEDKKEAKKLVNKLIRKNSVVPKMTNKALVMNTLIENPDSRDDDITLANNIVKNRVGNDEISLATVHSLSSPASVIYTGLIPMSSVSKTRRTVMQKHPELRPEDENSSRDGNSDVEYLKCMENVPEFMIHVGKPHKNLDLSRSQIEILAKALNIDDENKK